MPEAPFELLDDPTELARYQGWSEEVYRDLLAVSRDEMSTAEFDSRYLSEHAILVLDMTGFTETTIHGGAVRSFLRILEAQQMCLPVFHETGARFVRAFADDLVALYAEPHAALDAALEIHRRSRSYESPNFSRIGRAECCIGIGCGPVYAIGPNLAMGDEMNRTSKLGEDTARGGETLVTARCHEILRGRSDVSFELQTSDDLIFEYYRATPRS